MPVDYDLVILGGTLEGRIAATAAVGYGARVALVEPPSLFEQRQQATYLLKGLQQLGEARQAQSVLSWFQPVGERGGGRVGISNTVDDSVDWSALVNWSAIAAQTQCPELSPAMLSASGVDVVLEVPERLSQQRQGNAAYLMVNTAQRRLSTRAVLAAFGTVPLPVFAAGVGTLPVPVPTGIERLLDGPTLPDEIAIWGGSPIAIDWAEALCSMGVQVTLVAHRFLSRQESDIRRLVRSHLTALGVNIVSTFPDNFEPFPGQQALADSSLLFDRHQPALSLPEFVTYPVGQYPDADYQVPDRTYLLSNKQLQTAHPRVFVCGGLRSSEPVPSAVAICEAKVAVRNALFLPREQTDEGAISQAHYRFATAGVPPSFALEGFALEGRAPKANDGRDWTVWTASEANSTDLHRVTPLPSYCKLMCKKGRLQSIHLFGAGAGEVIGPLAWMIGKPMDALVGSVARLSAGSSGQVLADLVRQAVEDFERSRWQPGHWRRDWSENWFNWRRSR